MSVDVLQDVLAAAATVFGREVTGDDNFFDLGGDSVVAVELAVAIEDRVGAEVDTRVVVDAANFAAIAERLAAASAGR
jgi:acyl carrier protein